MSVPEVLEWVKFSQKSGTLIFENRGIVKKVFIENGLIVSASSNDPKEYLGQILICFGLISEETLNEAFKRQSSEGKLLGAILKEHYGIKEEEILKALRIKIEETIYNLFLWEDGKFIFANSLSQLMEHDRLDAAITIDQVVFEGVRRLDEWKEFHKDFPTDDVVFRKKPAVTLPPELQGDFITEKIFASIDGQKTMRRILLETHAPEYRGFEVFAKLYWANILEVIKKQVAPKPKSSETAGEPALREAMKFYREKAFDRAYQAISAYLIVKPEDEEGQTLFRVVKEANLKNLYEACPPDAIPELAIDISNLNEKIFSSREGFLASRVNGQWDVKSLIMVSPLGELESLQIFKRLLDEGVIRLKKKG